MIHSLKTLAVVLATGAALTVPTISSAADTETRQQTVHYEDLDLTTLAGNAALYRRLSAAADNVCSSDADLELLAAARRCRQAALDEAVARVNNPLLTLINGGKPVDVVVMTAPAETLNSTVVVRR